MRRPTRRGSVLIEVRLRIGSSASTAVGFVDESEAAPSITSARLDTFSSSPRRRITITPCVERPSRLTSSTRIRITVPPVEISITW